MLGSFVCSSVVAPRSGVRHEVFDGFLRQPLWGECQALAPRGYIDYSSRASAILEPAKKYFADSPIRVLERIVAETARITRRPEPATCQISWTCGVTQASGSPLWTWPWNRPSTLGEESVGSCMQCQTGSQSKGWLYAVPDGVPVQRMASQRGESQGLACHAARGSTWCIQVSSRRLDH